MLTAIASYTDETTGLEYRAEWKAGYCTELSHMISAKERLEKISGLADISIYHIGLSLENSRRS